MRLSSTTILSTLALLLTIFTSVWGQVDTLVVQTKIDDLPTALYEDRSGETQLNYLGTPYSSVGLDYDNDGARDLMVSIQDQSSALFRQTDLNVNNVPEFLDRTLQAFGVGQGAPQAGLRGMAVADYDNDGDLDFFAAAFSSPRLYRNNGDTPRTFTDVAPSVGVSPTAEFSYTGTWGDYNRDGLVDLYVGRAHGSNDPDPSGLGGVPDLLFRNDGYDGSGQPRGVFQDVTVAAGLTFTSVPATLTASWADIDGDGDLDIYAGHGGDQPGLFEKLFMNDGDFTFSEQSAVRFITQPWGTSGAVWEDIDGDHDLDLVTSTQLASAVQLAVRWNDGSGLFHSALVLVTADRAKGLSAFDFDLDGDKDIILLPERTNEAVFMLSNDMGSIDEFSDVAATVGLSGSGPVNGASVADFNLDGDPDVFLGRPVSQNKFFYRNTDAGSEDPKFEWLQLELIGGGGNNVAAIGATVESEVNGKKLTQVVDGGSARGGQSSTRLMIGTGGNTGSPVDVTITWPDGGTKQAFLAVGSVVTMEDTTEPTIKQQTVTASYTPGPGATADWTFSWETEYGSRPSLDKVVVSSTGACLPSPITLMPDQPNVTVTYQPKVGGGYVHSLVAAGMACVPMCSLNYYVESATDFKVSNTSGSQKKLKIGLCIQ